MGCPSTDSIKIISNQNVVCDGFIRGRVDITSVQFRSIIKDRIRFCADWVTRNVIQVSTYFDSVVEATNNVSWDAFKCLWKKEHLIVRVYRIVLSLQALDIHKITSDWVSSPGPIRWDHPHVLVKNRWTGTAQLNIVATKANSAASASLCVQFYATSSMPWTMIVRQI